MVESINCITTGKDKYVTEKDAWRMAEYLSMTGFVYCDVYHCGYCQHWHLTKNIKDRRLK